MPAPRKASPREIWGKLRFHLRIILELYVDPLVHWRVLALELQGCRIVIGCHHQRTRLFEPK